MRKVILFGASLGGIQSLCTVLKELPSDLDAAVLAVIHTGQGSHFLPHVLKRCCHLRVISPQTAEPIAAGHLYVAAPNRHLIAKSHCVMSWMGPRENRHRPAVDALFRSVARLYRDRVIAAVLSGAQDDGTAGALAVKARGGTVIVQDPREAIASDMPINVLRHMDADYCLPLNQIAPLMVKLVSKGPAIKFKKPTPKECEAMVESNFMEMEPPGFTCPDCGGVVMQIQNGKSVQFRCHVGHAFSLQSFSEAHADALERALWVALRKLNEQSQLQQSLAAGKSNTDPLKKRHSENAEAAKHDMRLLHEILFRL